ncbi:MAG TPA: hypothetical protein VH518_06130 [Tepidisphaeraceae bacterium]|jgi:hypothetical protein
MKTKAILVLAVIVACCAIHIACTQDQERKIAYELSILGPTTRAAEQIQQKLDPIARSGEQIAQVVKQAAETGATFGIPGAGAIALGASIVGTVLGVYNERRKGTLPLRAALTQVVQSIEAAFPDKTDEQKSALSSIQDRATKQLVGEIKGS